MKFDGIKLGQSLKIISVIGAQECTWKKETLDYAGRLSLVEATKRKGRKQGDSKRILKRTFRGFRGIFPSKETELSLIYCMR